MNCPMCGGPGVPLGNLGKLFWQRCRNCGYDFAEEINGENKDSDDQTD